MRHSTHERNSTDLKVVVQSDNVCMTAGYPLEYGDLIADLIGGQGEADDGWGG